MASQENEDGAGPAASSAPGEKHPQRPSALQARWERGLGGKCCSENKRGESAMTQGKFYVTIVFSCMYLTENIPKILHLSGTPVPMDVPLLCGGSLLTLSLFPQRAEQPEGASRATP